MSIGSKQESKRCWLLLVVLGTALAILGCSKENIDPTGGETHFLRVCDPGDDSCGELSCLCGVCSLGCADDSTCALFSGSECRQKSGSACGDSEPVSSCENGCEEDADCLLLSARHRCVDGACRLAKDGTAPEVETDCSEDGVVANEVVVIGDSFLASSHEITAFLEEFSRSAGVLQPGERYRDYSRLTENWLALSEPGIQEQYETATAEAAAKVVIMNGGGADVLLGDCEEATPDCPLVVDAAQAFEELLELMADDGVKDVVFAGYPKPEPADVLERMELLRPLLEERCEQSPVPCHWVDLRPVFEGNYDDYVQPGGLNPTTAGSEASAAALWEIMVENCIAQ